MKLLIDIGNTNSSIAFFDKKKVEKRYFIHTDREHINSSAFKRLIGKKLLKIDAIIIVSVVPKFLALMKKSFKSIMPGIRIYVVGKDITVPMRIRYKNPKEVGQDRLVASYAAVRLSQAPVIVIDFGTAVTFDYVNKRGEYEGGLIFPGLRLALKSLLENTALLPDVSVIKPVKGLIGRNTLGSINKGVVLGYSAVCDSFIKSFQKKYGASINVVATGGDAAFIRRYTVGIKKVFPDLIFTGLSLLLENIK
ncbi:MAG: type III pantothenate kinase [Candidatus Omnitrophica bacterium]|nr:type III pantothenate kinase [Candidatus Omnitrophota bacterium]